MKILAAIVDEYITTGEPVGSKVLAQKPDINVSPATIRNTMAALEQDGYLDHPHTSAGRVPTFKGYRFYIDNLMSPEPVSQAALAEFDERIFDGAVTEEDIIKNASELAQRRATQIVEGADEKAAGILRRAESEAALERKKATEGIKREIVDVSSALAEKMLEREIDTNDHRVLIDSFIEKIGDGNDGDQ